MKDGCSVICGFDTPLRATQPPGEMPKQVRNDKKCHSRT